MDDNRIIFQFAEYLSIDSSNITDFIVKHRRTIVKFLKKYGVPKSFQDISNKATNYSPLVYSENDYEWCLKRDFGVYSGTQFATQVDFDNDIVVYTYK